MVLNIDVAPTFLGLAGVAVPGGMQGLDFAGLFKQHPSAWRSAFLFEYFPDPAYPEVPIAFALRTDSAKLIRYENNPAWVELFDLRHDPYETNNLAHNPALRGHLERMHAELVRQARALQLALPGALEHLP
jgi:arylsulfatase A-like enzyme